MEQLRRALASNRERTLDFFRDCDADGSGMIDRREFRMAVGKVVPNVTKGVIAALFDQLDTDKSDTLEYAEIHAQLRQRDDLRAAATKAARPRRRIPNARVELYRKLIVGRSTPGPREKWKR